AVHLVTVPTALAPAALVAPPAHMVEFVLPGPVRTPPLISGFGVAVDDGVFILSGNVSDSNTPVAGMVVAFGGIFANYHLTATVLVDGTFSASMKIPSGGMEG